MPRPEYFYARVTDRPYHQKGFYSRISKEDAERKAAEWLTRHTVSRATVAELAEEWLADIQQDKKQANFKATYDTPTRTHIIPAFGNQPPRNITQADIKTFYRSLSKLSQSSLDKISICLHSFWDYIVEKGNDDYNKAAILPRPVSHKDKAEKRVLSETQYNKRYADIERECPEAAIILLAGHRIGELCGIRTDDIKDLDPDIVPIYRSIMPDGTVKPPKSNQSRFIPCKQAADLIHRISLNTPHGYLFGNGDEPPRPAAIAARITRAFKELGLPDLTPHELRHTFATRCHRSGMKINDIQKLLGHASIKTTEIYIKNEIDPLRTAMKQSGMY